MLKNLDDVKPSIRALRVARCLGAEIALTASWLWPLPEEHLDDAADLGALSDAHRDAWYQTDAFQFAVVRRLEAVAADQEIALTGRAGGFAGFDLVKFEQLHQPLLAAFWDRWEEVSGFNETAASLLARRDVARKLRRAVASKARYDARRKPRRK